MIAAHCASEGKGRDIDATGTKKQPTMTCFRMLLRLFDEPKYNGLLFADISAMIGFLRLGDPLTTMLDRVDLHSRLLGASDYPVPAVNLVVWTSRLHGMGYITKAEAHQLTEIYHVNPLLMDFVAKRTLRSPKSGNSFSPTLFDWNTALFGPIETFPYALRSPEDYTRAGLALGSVPQFLLKPAGADSATDQTAAVAAAVSVAPASVAAAVPTPVAAATVDPAVAAASADAPTATTAAAAAAAAAVTPSATAPAASTSTASPSTSPPTPSATPLTAADQSPQSALSTQPSSSSPSPTDAAATVPVADGTSPDAQRPEKKKGKKKHKKTQ